MKLLVEKKSLFTTLLLCLFLGSALFGCMPQGTPVREGLNDESVLDDNDDSNQTSGELSFPFEVNFFQSGVTQSSGALVLPLGHQDSFLLRGKVIHDILKSLPSNTSLCLMSHFPNASAKKVLVLNANIRSYNDVARGTTEFYLSLTPSDESANQTHCLTAGLLQVSQNNYQTNNLAFSFNDLCSSCTTGQSSNELLLYFNSGNLVPNAAVGALSLTLNLSNSSNNNNTQQCTSNSFCQSSGYSCCLNNQCVNDGAIQAGVDQSSSEFQAAQADVNTTPSNYTSYPQFYYVCGYSQPTDPSNGSDPANPNYAAQKRLLELNDLYRCLNPQYDEIAYCTLKFENAKSSINPNDLSVPPGDTFSAPNEDLNFSQINNLISGSSVENNIYEIRYAGDILYRENDITFDPSDGYLNNDHNDTLASGQSAFINKRITGTPVDTDLYLTYKVDGSCEVLGASLARCKKSYTQGQVSTPPRPSDHNSASRLFRIPSYADLTYQVIVKVGGDIVASGASTWSLSGYDVSFESGIVSTGQTVTIDYYVGSQLNSVLSSVISAQEEVNTKCECGDDPCNLTPVYENNTIVNYDCVYPANDQEELPDTQIAYVSAKSMPHRFFDTNGTGFDNEDINLGEDQEGSEFTYTSNNPMKPNNQTTYIGFNEIYGSINDLADSPYPARMVQVKKNTNYDIFVEEGLFSGCANCGNDYESTLKRIFPESFASMGGGYSPEIYNSSRLYSTSTYNADDMKFGRACFVPATMIPWTHMTQADVKIQRRNRLKTQHFLYANGLNRDWYGFDYGSLIGSFDGVTWFSIGNERRIKTKSEKLYIAVNAYFSDLTVDNTYKVVVSESASVINAGSQVDHDLESSGAQCQQMHLCDTDNDCIRQLGYDYTCQNISQVKTSWPIFDSSGAEVVGSQTKTIASLVGGTNGSAKRCVYRGRGAPCDRTINSIESNNNTFYNGTTKTWSAMCSANHYCAQLSTSNFNNKIARYEGSPKKQNLSEVSPQTDEAGLGARVIGRPYEYYGSNPVDGTVVSNLATNSISAVCIPGKNPNQLINGSTFINANQIAPSSNIDRADKILSVGVSTANTSDFSVALCPTTDTGGDFYHMNAANTSLSLANLSTQFAKDAVNQNISSNIYDLTIFDDLGIYSSTNGSLITGKGIQRNTCLRAPGASCFSDLECVSSKFIADKVKTISDFGSLNEAEQNFLTEQLVCGNPNRKTLSTGANNPDFDINENKCCRETNNKITITSADDQSSGSAPASCSGATPAITGLNISYQSGSRNTRLQTVADVLQCGVGTYPALRRPVPRAGADTPMDINLLLNQYNTLDLMNQRTCCTGHWVRNFSAENSGGHKWGEGKHQNIDNDIFKDISWFADDSLGANPDDTDTEDFACTPENYTTLECEIKNLSPAEEDAYLAWLSKLELIGIPQAVIPNENSPDGVTIDVTTNQAAAAANTPLRETILAGEAPDVDGDGNEYISLTSYDKLDMTNLKQVFSEDEFSCCLPAGDTVPSDTTDNMCCTGTAVTQDNSRRCCLPDFSDVTVYLNRYISSEGRGLSSAAYDPKTGYIRDPAQVLQLAQAKNLCCSGNIQPGSAIANLNIPMEGDQVINQATSRRFTYRDDAVDSNAQTGSIGSIYNAGLRWNTHYYCAPQGFVSPNDQ